MQTFQFKLHAILNILYFINLKKINFKFQFKLRAVFYVIIRIKKII